MKHHYKNLLKHCSFYLGGDQPYVPWLEKIRSVVGAFIGLMLVLTTAKYLGEVSGLDEWLIASLGASALLVFARQSYGSALGCYCWKYPLRIGWDWRNSSNQ